MTIELLIEAIVRQTTILIAQLATSGGTRAPLAQVAGQVFLDLVHELERQGVSRKVSADMFGLGLRTYQRKIQRFLESSTDRGRSLWVAVLDYVERAGTVTRAQVLVQFASDDESQVRGVLRDLTENGLNRDLGQRLAPQLPPHLGRRAAASAARAIQRRFGRALVGAHLSRRPVHAGRAAQASHRHCRARAGARASAGGRSRRAKPA